MNTNQSNGLGVGTLLALIFMTLKLCHIIAWSWWWVLAPVWIPAGLVLIIYASIGIALLIAHFMKG
jgi:hypothetical protein